MLLMRYDIKWISSEYDVLRISFDILKAFILIVVVLWKNGKSKNNFNR